MNEQTTTNTAAHDEPLAVLPPVDDDAAGREAVREKMADALTPGFQVEFDPDEAERVGAFVEDALSEQDAAASGDDLVEVDGALEPAARAGSLSYGAGAVPAAAVHSVAHGHAAGQRHTRLRQKRFTRSGQGGNSRHGLSLT